MKPSASTSIRGSCFLRFHSGSVTPSPTSFAGFSGISAVPVHAHANLVGWASLALFGLTYRAYPALKDGRLARIHELLPEPLDGRSLHVALALEIAHWRGA